MRPRELINNHLEAEAKRKEKEEEVHYQILIK